MKKEYRSFKITEAKRRQLIGRIAELWTTERPRWPLELLRIVDTDSLKKIAEEQREGLCPTKNFFE